MAQHTASDSCSLKCGANDRHSFLLHPLQMTFAQEAFCIYLINIFSTHVRDGSTLIATCNVQRVKVNNRPPECQKDRRLLGLAASDCYSR